MRFIFKAKDQTGAVKKGTIESISEQAAVQALQKSNLVPIFVEQEKRTPAFIREIQRIWEGVSQRELVVFFRQLATLIEAKVPITQSLAAIEEQTTNKFLCLVIREITEDVREGMPFSESLEKHPTAFSPIMVSVVRAGEVSGNLQRAISFVADNAEKNYQLVSKIRSALLYPSFVITVAFIIGFLVITVILPKLTGIIKELDVAIPWYTRAIIFIGDFMANFWWAVLIVIVGLIGGFLYYVKTEAGKREWDQVKIKLPILGNFFRSIYLARFADNLSLMLTAGIPIVRALIIVSEVVGNSVHQSIILRSADEVKTGGHISTVFAKSSDVPPIVSQMTKIGEETGKLGEVLKNVSSFYEQEVDKTARNLSTMIEPILIVILGIGVAILVFAILLPIYNIAGKL
ncbi:MAG: type II secretion system F family protein [Candidatus Moranbacteria bacterium]|nr:type II secretion system F family protein [Candidatus Moranbacteria bacterium]